jgi:hypothetical protein
MIDLINLKLKEGKLLEYFFWKIGLIRLYKFIKNPNYFLKLSLLKYLILFIPKLNTKSYINLKFKFLKFKKSDINEHLDVLNSYALKCDTILETGVRGVVSSWAFLKGLNDNNKIKKKLILNDIEDCNIKEIQQVCKNAKIDFEFIKKNNLDLEFSENFDLIFIDTWHVYGQLSRELAKFSKISNKFIILHDTTVDAEFGESIRLKLNIDAQAKASGFTIDEISKGLWPAVEEFIGFNENWIIEKRYTNCNGLTVLKRV